MLMVRPVYIRMRVLVFYKVGVIVNRAKKGVS
jgi:hypothetical protein